jgi:drug/metabolite transporter (DMT)-like permease
MTELTLQHRSPSKALVIAAFAALYVIWGSTYIAIAISLKTIPPFLMAGSRFLVAGVIVLAWCLLRGQSLPDGNSIAKLILSGILMPLCGTVSLVWVEQYISSGLASIIVATLPLWFVALDKRQWKFHFSNAWILIGLAIGFAGVMLLFGDKALLGFSGDNMKVISFFVLVAGTILWAIGSLFSKYTTMQGSAAMKGAIQMITAGVLSLCIGFIVGEQKHFSWNQVSTESFLAVVYLIVMGSLVGYMSYIWLLEVRPPSLVGTYAYVNPVVAVFLGWLIMHEVVTRQQIIALAVILAGVILVNFSKDKLGDKKK